MYNIIQFLYTIKQTNLVDASNAGEGSLEILVQVGEHSLLTDVEPLGSAIFGVSFQPLESDAINSRPPTINDDNLSVNINNELLSAGQQQLPPSPPHASL